MVLERYHAWSNSEKKTAMLKVESLIVSCLLVGVAALSMCSANSIPVEEELSAIGKLIRQLEVTTNDTSSMFEEQLQKEDGEEEYDENSLLTLNDLISDLQLLGELRGRQAGKSNSKDFIPFILEAFEPLSERAACKKESDSQSYLQKAACKMMDEKIKHMK